MPPQLGGAPAQVVETSLEFVEIEGQMSSPGHIRLKADSTIREADATYPPKGGRYNP